MTSACCNYWVANYLLGQNMRSQDYALRSLGTAER